MSLKLKLVATSLLAAFSLSVNATTLQKTGTLNPGTGSESVQFTFTGGSLFDVTNGTMLSGSFLDSLTFTNVKFDGITLVDLFPSLAPGKSWGLSIPQATFAAGNHFLTFDYSNASSSSTYFSSVTYVSAAPVPEPETYAMMLAGLGALGFMARRRQAK